MRKYEKGERVENPAKNGDIIFEQPLTKHERAREIKY